MDGGVDTLVYQLEDDDPNIRWETIQKLRKLAAVERVHFPVRNPRRFLHCVRRRLSDKDPEIACEALRLVVDVMGILGDDAEQILSSILPHLIAKLPEQTANQTQLQEETFQVFRKYVNVCNDLMGVMDVLINLGLAHGHANVREASLLTILRLLEERYGRHVNVRRKRSTTTQRVDKALFISLTQAIVPILEDEEESVVVVAEEAVARLQTYWGEFQEVMQYLSGQDKMTLQSHSDPIQAFYCAARSKESCGAASSVTESQVIKLRTSLARSSNYHTPVDILLFVTPEIVDILRLNTGNSNAEWKKRTAAVERLYSDVKQQSAALEEVSSLIVIQSLSDELIEILIRLLQDIDIHLAKRGLQILRIIVVTLDHTLEGEGVATVDARGHVHACVDKLMPYLVETIANYIGDDEMENAFYGVLLALCQSVRILDTVAICNSLYTSLQHRRLQIREEALRIWMVTLLQAEHQDGMLTLSDVLDSKMVHALGRVLGDTSTKVRDMAFEAVAVLAAVTRNNRVCVVFEESLDGFVLDRIDMEALYDRLSKNRVPVLSENGRLVLCISKSAHERDEVSSKSISRQTNIQASGPSLDGVSELSRTHIQSHTALLGVNMKASDVYITESPSVDQYEDCNEDSGPKVSQGVSRRRVKPPSIDERVVSSSSPCESLVIADKLSALKRKTAEKLKRSASSKCIKSNTSDDEILNPQDGEEYESLHRSQTSPERLMTCPNLIESFRTPSGLNNPVSKQSTFDEVPSSVGRQKQSRLDAISPNVGRQDKLAVRSSTQSGFDENPPCLVRQDKLSVLDSKQSRSVEIPPSDEGSIIHLHSSSPREPDDRPIRPLKVKYEAVVDSGEYPRVLKRRSDDEVAGTNGYNANTSLEDSSTSSRPISLATKKRLAARAIQEKSIMQVSDETEESSQPNKRSSGFSNGGGLPGPGKNEPRYLESHEIKPLLNFKQDASKVVNQLQSENWEDVFDALNIVRRLATHHPTQIEGKLHTIICEILKQVPNLRSSVAKNALLALDTLCATFGRGLDAEVDNIMPVLMKRSLDSNTFVTESATSSINAVILNCSTQRVVSAITAHLSNRAIAIRREVARALHTVIVSLADDVQYCKELASIALVIGKCLEDSNNEVRDVAKQSILYLHNEQRMDAEKLKKMFPTNIHGKVISLLSNRSVSIKPGGIPKVRAQPQPSQKEVEPREKKLTTGSRSTFDNEILTGLVKKLDSNNWKDRFDAINEATIFIDHHGGALCESGKFMLLFDGIIARMEDGNAKVSTLTLESLPKIIIAVGNGIDAVLQAFVPVIAKCLAASNAKQVSLTQNAIQSLCTCVEARLLCQHFALVARNANSRTKPMLLDVLAQLAQHDDDKTQSVLMRYVLPLALDQLKEVKNDIKDSNVRLLRTLYKSLGESMILACGKCSGTQRDKLYVILGVSLT